MGQLDLLEVDAPAVTEQAVWLRCWNCAFTWHSATTRSGVTWYPQGAELAAKVACCPQCEARPPMQVAAVEER